MKKVNDLARQPVMEFSDVVLDFQSASTPLSFTLRKGDFAFLRASSLALVASRRVFCCNKGIGSADYSSYREYY
tara:strand:- start:901 stop:1122 length:222 start_codon:yes stop_codon:yes gene_type:complete